MVAVPEWATLVVVVAAVVAYVHLWARGVPVGDFGSARVRLIVRLTSYFRISYDEADSVVGLCRYLAPGIGGGIALSLVFGVDLVGMFVPWVDLDLLAITLLGTLSATQLAPAAVVAFGPDVNVFEDVMDVGWIASLQRLPGRFAPLGPISSAVVEEFFFRGVLVSVLVIFLPAWAAIVLGTVIFTYEQVLFLETRVQMVVIGGAAVVIGLVGGVLLLYTDSVVPSMIVHASFVYYYVGTQSAFQ